MKIWKMWLYLICIVTIITSLFFMLIIFIQMSIFGGIILYEHNIAILTLELIFVSFSLLVSPFMIYDYIKKERL